MTTYKESLELFIEQIKNQTAEIERKIYVCEKAVEQIEEFEKCDYEFNMDLSN